MGLFDKETMADMANSFKDGVKEVGAEIEERQRLGLVRTVITSKLEYRGGYPKANKEGKYSLTITNDDFKFSKYKIQFDDVTGVHFESMDQISSRLTATRMVLLGPFALAFKKKKRYNEKYLTIDFNENGVEGTMVFGGKNVQDAYKQFYQRYSGFVKRKQMQQIDEDYENVETTTNSNSNDPYEEIKKAKELLDMGIITQDEFDQKKKELLGL